MLPLDAILRLLSDSRLVWFLVGLLTFFCVPSRFLSTQKPPVFLERDSKTDQLGVQTFSGISYIQVSVKSSVPLKCKAWITRVDFSEDDIWSAMERGSDIAAMVQTWRNDAL